MLATHSLLPVIQAFSRAAGIDVRTCDISLAGRILAAFSDFLPEEQRVPDGPAELGRLVKSKEANIIKLPNISASVPQIQAAVKELQAAGFAVPDFPAEASAPEEKEILGRFEKVMGSAVNPVLRGGNSDRRPAAAVKRYARKNPHAMDGWSSASATHVSSMSFGDFYASEKSCLLNEASDFRIEFIRDGAENGAGSCSGGAHTRAGDTQAEATANGNAAVADGNTAAIQILRETAPLEKNELLDAAVMNRKALRNFLREQKNDARARGVLFSIHLKATMMKVSDPVIFGEAVFVFLEDFFQKHETLLNKLGVKPELGLAALTARLEELEDAAQKDMLLSDLKACLEAGPAPAMVNSDEGITNLHVPSDVIIDASMPAAFKSGGRMWGPDGRLHDMKAVIPDRSYAGVYQAVIDFCRENGAFNPATMGSVSNVGLMAGKAEEYGSHDKTFLAPGNGVIRAVCSDGRVLLEQPVEEGDIFRMCQTKDNAVRNWVELAVQRARAEGTPAVFWLDEKRAHDRLLTARVRMYLAEMDTAGLDISIAAPEEACRQALRRARDGQDTISVSGNVLRDYLTDLFPILELGTSARMLSIVPLLSGGGLFETGAGGSAPKHVQQLLEENHLRWDSLGEFLALGVSYEHLAEKMDCKAALVLSRTLDEAVGRLLDEGRLPSRKCGEQDNRTSHFYLALYWAEALAAQQDDLRLREIFVSPAAELAKQEEAVVACMLASQGKPADIGGYYRPDKDKLNALMRPSGSFNRIIEGINTGRR